MPAVNCRVKHIRSNEFWNLEEWCENENNVYIARRGIVIIDGKRYPAKSSPFCNPFEVTENQPKVKYCKNTKTIF